MIKNNEIIKKIILVLLVIVMTSNFVIPNYVYAAGDGLAEKVIASFFQLLTYLGDVVVAAVQQVMIGDNYIGGDLTSYNIKYSPGVIFSNNVPALDINFLDPMEAKEYYNIGADKQSVTFPDAELGPLLGGPTLTNKKMNRVKSYYVGGDWFINGYQDDDYWQEAKEAAGFYSNDSYNVFDTKLTGAGKTALNNFDDFLDADIHDWATSGTGFWEDIEDALESDSVEHRDLFYDASTNRLKAVILFVIRPFGYLGSWCYTDFYAAVYQSDPLSADLKNKVMESAYTKSEVQYKESIAAELRDNISTWYRVFRTIALVGLLSVLLYIGIKVLLNSASAQENAKYKKMLKDWLVAICLIFVLHYIMAFMLSLTGSLNSVIETSVVTEETAEGYTKDILMSTMRNKVGRYSSLTQSYDGWEKSGYAVMYLALVVLTVIFTVQYLKRVVMMAFFTMIAPMIAFTYPLDKMKDAKAQAFNYWLKEYMFNCLIQPVHLLLYTVFVKNALDFAQDNILYAIVCLTFMVPAEKIIKEMFGMKAPVSSASFETAAAGAMIMSAVQKLRGSSSRDGASSAGSGASLPKAGRTITRIGGGAVEGAGNVTKAGGTALEGSGNALKLGGKGISTAGSGLQAITAGIPGLNVVGAVGGAGLKGIGAVTSAAGTGIKTAGTATKTAGTTMKHVGSTIKKSSASPRISKPISGIARTASTLGRFTKKGIGGTLSLAAKGTGYVLPKAVGIGTGIMGAGLGLAVGVASGDLGKGLKYAGAGALAGYSGGNNFTRKIGHTVSNIPKKLGNARYKLADTYRERGLTAEQINNRRFDREFFKSDDYKYISEDAGIQDFARSSGMTVKGLTQDYLDNGITDTGKIREALQYGVYGNDYADFASLGVTNARDMANLIAAGVGAQQAGLFKDAGITSTTEMVKLNSAGIGAQEYGEYISEGIKSVDKIVKMKQKHPRMSDRSRANWMNLASSAPKNLADFKAQMVGKTFNGVVLSDNMAEEVFKKLVDFF